MQTYPDEPRTPQAQTQTHPSNPSALPPAFGNSGNAHGHHGAGTPTGAPGTPVRFAATTGAFNLTVSTAATPPPRDLQPGAVSPTAAVTPPSNGTVATHKLRRPSLLSLVPSTGASEPEPAHGVSAAPATHLKPGAGSGAAGPAQPASTGGGGGLAAPVPTFATSTGPRWGLTAFSAPARVGSAPPIPIEGLTTSTSPIPARSENATSMEEKWQLRRSSGDGGQGLGRAPFPGRPIPGSLLATLISESSPLEHEMRSEARLQRFISSHPSAIPLTLTPRQRRLSRMARGRFPESVDDDDDGPAPLALGARWRDDSDTDSDDMMDDEWPAPASSAVNSAFASVMDIDRPGSNGSFPRSGASGASEPRSDSGKSTPSTNTGNKGTPQRLEPGWKGARIGQSPGASTLITSFGNVGFAASAGSAASGASGVSGVSLGGASASASGASGRDTPLGSPTVEKSELAGSAGSPSVNSPGMMQYRDPGSRAGKRKGEPSSIQALTPAANVEDRFDPYKRPRASSPSPFQALSPSKSGVAPVPIPSSPSHAPLVASSLATSSPGYLSLGQSRVKPPHHPYTRPMASRSRAASPALSIGSTSGVLSSSLNGKIGGAFIPTGPGASAAVSAAQSQGAAPGSLGSLGLLSLQAEHGDQQEMLRDDVCDERRGSAEDAMDED